MRIVSWYVNGLRAAAKKGFADFLERSGADIVGVQEVRALPEQLDPTTRMPSGWHSYFAPASRRGYSGVGLFTRIAASRTETSLGDERFDTEGRVIIGHFGKMVVASVYFPNGSGKDRNNSRVPYKLDFYRALFDRLQHLRKRRPVFVMGDFNTAHQDIDLARPTSNRKTSGFLPEERAEMSRWMDAGWIDVFRRQYPDQSGHYTWWRQWGDARANNVGWRIDYVLASKSAARRVSDAFIWPHETGSDHCPVGIDVD